MAEADKKNKKRVLIGIFLILFSAFIMLSLISHSPADYSQSVYPTNDPILNKGGKIGAAISYYFFIAFGLSSFIIAGFIGFWGILLLIRKEIEQIAIKIISLIFFVLASIAFLALLTPDPENFRNWNLSVSMETFGGFIGYLLTSFTISYFGYFGSYVLALFLLFLSAILATDWVAYDIAKKIFKLVMPLFIGLGKFLFERIKPLFTSKPVVTEESSTPQITAITTTEQTSNDETPTEMELPVVTNSSETSPKATPKPKRIQQRSTSGFKLPPLDLLEDAVPTTKSDDRDIKEQGESIQGTLNNFGVPAKIVNIERGPVITKYEIELGPGISVHKLAGMADDFAIALKAPNVRIVAPIPGKATVGIEVPNAYKGIVKLKELLIAKPDETNKKSLPLFIGKDAAGAPLVLDLDDMPHLLIAGTTGSGKSICIGSVVLSLLMTRTPDELKLLMIDPKMVELSAFKDIPHLISPVVTDMRRAPLVLKWLTRTMDERYELFLKVGVKKIDSYNQLSEEKIREKLSEDGELPVEVPTRLPYIVVMIDEFADLMMAASDEIEAAITRISQKSRAVGIHLVMATQRPSVDVITGLIKSNMPARIAFKVASKIDSRTILDRNGAEKLLGHGDMLILQPSSTDLVRAQGTWVNDKETHEVVTYLKNQGEPVFDEELLSIENKEAFEEIEQDDLFEEAAKTVLETQRGSVSLIQRKLGIGYSRAARLIEMMARVGIVGEYKNSKAREVVMTLAEWENAKRSREE
jgi:S-DNA-T family DNA segregation ATPase FtsK/SpoIIIE